MMKKFLCLGMIFCVVVLAGCGEKFSRLPSGFTEVVFTNGRAPSILNSQDLSRLFDLTHLWDEQVGIQTLNGGVVVFAQNSMNPGMKGRRVLGQTEDGNNTNWMMPNGTYYFYSIGYTGANMGSGLYCGIANNGSPLSLNGGSMVVPILLTTNCLSNAFNTSATAVTILKVHNCTAATNISAAVVPASDTCGSLSGAAGVTYGSGSFEFAFFTHDEFFGPNPPNELSSSVKTACTNLTAGLATNNTVTITPGDPAFAPSIRLKSEIVLYAASGCAGAHTVFSFDAGLNGAGDASVPGVRVFQDGAPADANAKFIISGNTVAVFTKP